MKRSALLVLAVVVLGVPIWHSVRTSQSRSEAKPGELKRGFWLSLRDLLTSEDVRASERAREDRLRAEQGGALEKCRAAVQVGSEALAEIDRWKERTEALLGSEEGRAVSADRAFVRDFAELYRRKRPGRELIAANVNIARGLVESLERARGQGSLVVPELTDVEKGTAVAAEARTEYVRDRERLEALLKAAVRSPAVGAVLLSVALQDHLASLPPEVPQR